MTDRASDTVRFSKRFMFEPWIQPESLCTRAVTQAVQPNKTRPTTQAWLKPPEES